MEIGYSNAVQGTKTPEIGNKLVLDMDNLSEQMHNMTPEQEQQFRKAISVRTVQKNVNVWTSNYRDNSHSMILDPVKNMGFQEMRPHPNVPAICVGAGPSLMQNIHLLKKFKKKTGGIIITSDKCLRDVYEQGVVPDYVVHADSNPVTEKFYEDVPITEGTSAIFATVINPAIPKHIPGKIFWFNASIPNDIFPNAGQFFQLMNNKPNISFGGNIGSLAWLVAKHMKCNPIGMIGFDMSWGKNSPKNYMIDQKGNPLYYKSDNDDSGYEYKKNDKGEKIQNKSVFEANGFPGCYTDLVFWNYRNAFLERLRIERHRNAGMTINCTEGGIMYEPAGKYPVPKLDAKNALVTEDKTEKINCEKCGTLVDTTTKIPVIEKVTIGKLPSMTFKKFISGCNKGKFKRKVITNGK